jgi:hypothetical protein
MRTFDDDAELEALIEKIGVVSPRVAGRIDHIGQTRVHQLMDSGEYENFLRWRFAENHAPLDNGAPQPATRRRGCSRSNPQAAGAEGQTAADAAACDRTAVADAACIALSSAASAPIPP